MPPATDGLCQSYLDLQWHLDPAQATEAGASVGDDRLGSFDHESIRRHLAALKSIAAAVEDLDVSELSEEIDRTALLDDIRSNIFRFEIERPHVVNPGFWLGHVGQALYSLLIRADGGEAHRAAAALARLEAVPGLVDAAEDTLEQPPRVFIDAALEVVEGAGRLVAQSVDYFGALAPERRAELVEAGRSAQQALEGFGETLRGDLEAHPDELSFAVGQDQFERRLHHEHALRESAPELWRYGQRLQQQVEERLESLAAELGGRPWRDLVAESREDGPEPSEALAAFQAALERSRSFVVDHDLVDLPVGALELQATPEFLRPLIPFAAYQPPGPFSASRTGQFYVTTEAGPAGSAPRHAAAELPILAAHEAYPGHHLQLLTAQQQPSLVRRCLWSPVTVEGWALYCEQLMADEGFFESPGERLAQLSFLLWRAVRVTVDVGLHTRGMTPDEAISYLTDHLVMDRAAARAEVLRYCAYPTYQLCYAVGRGHLLSLREDYRLREGSQFSLKEFHREVLSYGGLPVSLIRWGMDLEP